MSLHPTTLRGRLTLWYTGILTALLVLLGTGGLILLDRGLRRNIDDSLTSLAQTLAGSVRQPALFDSGVEESLQSMLGAELAERFYQLLDPLGRPDLRVAPRPRRRPGLPLSPQALENAEKGQATFETFDFPSAPVKPFRLLTYPVIQNGAVVNIVQVAMSLENVHAARSKFILILLSLSPLALGGAALGGWFLARRALAPVDAMVETARKIEAEDLSRRIPALASEDELSRLAGVLNDMFARLERSFGAVQRFSADAAHELRTPLTIIKGEIEVALRSSPPDANIARALASCLEEVDRLNSLVETLLLMARMEGNALTTAPSRVNFSVVLNDVTPALAELAARAENTCNVVADPSLWVEGYDPLLFRLVFNLAENAIKYTPPNGAIDVTLRREGNDAVLAVRDDGPGISAEEQEHIFDRFYRSDHSRQGNGTGLGLALVRSIVQLHQGRIQVSSAPGKGSIFRVTLPLASAPATSTARD